MNLKEFETYIGQRVARLEAESAALKKDLAHFSKYPDIHISVSRSGKFIPISKAVNPKVIVGHLGGHCRCGQCHDKTMSYSAFITDEAGYEIYADMNIDPKSEPRDSIMLGHKWDYEPTQMEDNWKETLRARNISEAAIDYLERKLEAERREYAGEAEEETE